MKTPYFYTIRGALSSILLPPIFLFLFWLIYNPFVSGESPLIREGWQNHSTFCIAIITAIIFLVNLISRALLFIFRSKEESSSNPNFILWQICEVLADIFFIDLFISLFFHAPYAYHLLSIALYSSLTLVFPYLTLNLLSNIYDSRSRLIEAQQQLHEMEKGTEREDDPIKFVDEKGTVRLVLSPNKIISMESSGNYVDILYDNNGHASRFSLRNSLKAIEPVCTQHGLIRCHRSFFINLSKVRVLRKTPEGLMAEIDFEGVSDVPVSKSYMSEVFKRFNH